MPMKSLTIRLDPGQGYADPVHVYACNSQGYGLFFRGVNDGSYKQLRGTGTTPKFETADQFWHFLQFHAGIKGKVIESFW